MRAYGADHVREAENGKVILHSRLSKSWRPRKPKDDVHSEFPGTAVMWDEQYFEVVKAEGMQQGGVRYELEPWRDEHVIRVFDQYCEETELRRLEDYRKALAQRKKAAGARFSGIFLGFLPAHVQKHLENELGVSPARMTMLSCLLAVVLFGICVFFIADAILNRRPSPIPIWVTLLAMLLFAEAAARFLVAMSQNRGMGSLAGMFAYIAFWYLSPNRRNWPPPFEEEKGNRLFTLPPPDDVALRDALEMRAPWFTFLSPSEQISLAERYGYEYRKHAFGLSWIILIFSTIGVVSSFVKVSDTGSISALSSLIVAGVLAVEQIIRLPALQKGPAGSILGVFVRPFVRRFLEHG